MRHLFAKWTEGTGNQFLREPSGTLSVGKPTGGLSVKYPYSIPIVGTGNKEQGVRTAQRSVMRKVAVAQVMRKVAVAQVMRKVAVVVWVVLCGLTALAGMVGLSAVTATTASAQTSTYINADITKAKIGDLYYDLNTKTHKAAVVRERVFGTLLDIYNYDDLTSVDVPSTIKFQNPANYYKEEEFTVVEIGEYAFERIESDEKFTHLTIPSTVVYLDYNILCGNQTHLCTWVNGGCYFDNCMVAYNDLKDKYGEYLHEFKVREHTRIISEECIHAAYIRDLYFPEGKIIFSGNIFNLDSDEKNAIERIELWGTEVDGYFVKEQGDLIVYNYSGKIDYTLTSLYSINKMYVTRDVASLHPAKKWGDKVETFRFAQDGLYYELLNKEEAVVVNDKSYSSWGSKSITIPSTVTYKNHTFKVTTIDPEAFAGTNITSVTLPGTIKTIGQGAFSGCKKLTEVNFADEINVIGKQAFMGCTALKEINLNQVANIASEAFKGCTALTTLISGYQGIINAHSLAFDGLNKGNITVQVQSSLLSSYKADAFWKDFKFVSNRYKVDGLWYEVGGTGVKLVKEKNGEGNYAELTGPITIPKDIAVEGKYYTVMSIEKGALQYAPMTELDLRAEVTTIPEGFCFAASELEQIWLPESVVKIGDNAFGSCPKLWIVGAGYGSLFQLSLCSKLLSIGKDAFYDTDIQELVLPSSLTTIGEGAFAYCKELTKVYIQENVSTIGKYAFQNCTKLEYMRNDALAPQPFTTDMLYGVDKDKLEIEVQYGALNAFKTADGWKDYTFTAEPVYYGYYDEEDNFRGYLWYWIDLVTRTATL
ncbi:MAG: leucine-rich repeat domain-containing protein, partial [Paludibacteraceae bacterium]|nr:leucine-rich repeat domain-containing protein [Paludibacteraceae bacterium]